LLRSLGRELAKLISAAALMIGYLMVGLTRRKQGLHDVLAATAVVREGPARILLAVIVAFAGVLVPIIAVVMFGAFFAGLMAIFMGGMGTDAMKPVPQESQPARQPKPKPAATQAATPSPAATPAPAATPSPAAATPAPASEAKPAATTALPASTARTEAKPVVVPKAARPELAAAPAAQKPPAVEAIAMPAYRPGVEGPKYSDLTTAVLYRDPEAVEALLKFGKWPDKPDPKGWTPLMVAAQLGDVRSAELLLKAGADPNLSVQGGVSAGSIARERRDGAMLALLQRHGLR
jgi:hypothetical protein